MAMVVMMAMQAGWMERIERQSAEKDEGASGQLLGCSFWGEAKSAEAGRGWAGAALGVRAVKPTWGLSRVA